MVLRTALTLALNAIFDTCRGSAKRPGLEGGAGGLSKTYGWKGAVTWWVSLDVPAFHHTC